MTQLRRLSVLVVGLTLAWAPSAQADPVTYWNGVMVSLVSAQRPVGERVAHRTFQQFLRPVPVKARNYFRLLTLDSNVVATGAGSNAVNVGGQEVWNFGTYVDDTNNHSKWLTLQRAPQLGSSGFAIETVKEVQLITNQFSTEFGGHSAGVSSMITKTGTNQRRKLAAVTGAVA